MKKPLIGRSVSGTTFVRGIGWGVPYIVPTEEICDIYEETVCVEPLPEIERLKRAFHLVELQLVQLRDDFMRGQLVEEADIIAVQLALIKDSTLLVELIRQIRDEHVNSEKAISLSKAYLRKFFTLPSIQENRTFELLEDIFVRLLAELRVHSLSETTVVNMQPHSILVAEVLWPSRATELLQKGFAAIVTKEGGSMSHTALLARSKGIPFLSHVKAEDWDAIANAERLFVDGESSRIIINPCEEFLAGFSCLSKQSTQDPGKRHDRISCVTKDGCAMSVLASVEYTEDVSLEKMDETDGIGLYRSEYMIQEMGYVPQEEEQTAAFTHLIEVAGKCPVIIRTFDFSGDKQGLALEAMGASFPKRTRSLSEMLSHPSFFFPHVRAIVRAAKAGKVSVLFPMVSSNADFKKCRTLVDTALLSVLREEKTPFKIDVGAMVELPSIICQLPELLKTADFIALGTNDLLQYCLAVNRLGSVSCDRSLYLHEGFLSLLRYIATTCKRMKKKCIVCGEMPTDFGMLMVLVGLGFSFFTLPLVLVREAKKRLLRLNLEEAKGWVETLFDLPSQEERFQWLETWKQTYG